ncbi:hypothetical protein KIF59_03255 [Enterobacter cloacae subsp. cloacae]|nr:hypothetical protein [Enterobacter cloacae subsp. cloacae]
MYNTKTFPTPPDSWSVVFVKTGLTDGKTNQGRVQAYDGPIYIAGCGAVCEGHSNLFSWVLTTPQLTEEQYAAVLKVLYAISTP